MDRDRQVMNVQAERPQRPEQPGQPDQPDQPPYVGSSDLDAYGQWSEVPDEGWCWTPQVDAGWIPYTYGRWGYEPYFGWTWISFEPWGWAPYHYGTWFNIGGRWHWRPGGIGGRAGFYGGGYGGAHFLARGSINGRPGGNLPAFAARSTFMGSAGRMGFGSSVNTWHGFTRSQSGFRSGAGFQGRSAPGVHTSYQNNWQRYASPSPYGGGRQGYSSQSRSYSGGGYGGGSRPPLELNRPIMRQRAPSSGYYGGGYGGGRTYAAPSGGSYGGGRSYSAPSGGGRTSSAPSGGRSYSAPSGGGGGGHSYSGGGGGGHSSGGGGGHGGGHR
jgi:hypothetical protein